MTIVGVILIIIGASSLIQSFRQSDSMNEILKAGRDPASLQSTIWSLRLIGIAALGGGIYLVV
ncbi:hypothetical protein CK498_06660 [Halomonas salipaludis]|uniref:Uncharacterized protein n=1 Tax=Halomonas salipaludis TaxID=2032625 RepID=A0A2A2F1F7_9GAMM|nr:hypothetical protein CK498_06660 [Halomonas salipaludis]